MQGFVPWLWVTVLIALVAQMPSNAIVAQVRYSGAVKGDQTNSGDIPRIFQTDSDETINNAAPYPVHAGFPRRLNLWVERAAPIYVDLNGDGANELIVQSSGSVKDPGKIYAISSTGAAVPGFPINTKGQFRGKIAVGDINLDGTPEIVAGVDSFSKDVGGQVYVWRADGTIYPGWPQKTACYPNQQTCGITSIALEHIAGDPKLEVIAATSNRNLDSSNSSLFVPNLYVWHVTGALAQGNWPVDDDHNTATIGAIATGDMNKDGVVDIAAARDYNRLFAFTPTGSSLAGWPRYVFLPDDTVDYTKDRVDFARSPVTLADLDQNGTLEYIVNGLRNTANTANFTNTALLVYAANGKRWGSWFSPAYGAGLVNPDATYWMYDTPVIGDLNRDARPDIVIATQDGWIRAYSSDKKLLWEFDFAKGQETYAMEPVIGDVDGNGWNEVLFGTYNINAPATGRYGVWILDHNGLPQPNMPMQIDEPSPVGISGGPTLGDFDKDGKIEIAAVSWRGTVYVWDTPGAAIPAALSWPVARHDNRRTGRYIDPVPNFSRSAVIASQSTAGYQETVTYRFRIQQTGAASTETLSVTSALPAGLTYIPGSMKATVGQINDSQPALLRWSGSMANVNQVDITYSAIVNQQAPAGLVNEVTLNAGSLGQLKFRKLIIVNAIKMYLPCMRR